MAKKVHMHVIECKKRGRGGDTGGEGVKKDVSNDRKWEETSQHHIITSLSLSRNF